MRSAAYSVLMTLLLLVPISAVPLMAIFGVPQFTPLVSSPLAESDEPDDDWDRPARKKSRSAAPLAESDDDEVDVVADESLEWTDDEPERPRPLRKDRPGARARSTRSDEDAEVSFAQSAGYYEVKSSRRSKESGREAWDDSNAEDSSIQLASNAVPADESPFAESGEQEENQSEEAQTDAPEEAMIPRYRRQKSAARHAADPREGTSAPKKKKTSPPVEPLSWLTLSQRLNDFGIRNFHLESGEGEFTFTCTYTPSNSPHVTRKFEAVADDPLKAVAKVLVQVEEASQQKVMASPRRRSEAKKPREME